MTYPLWIACIALGCAIIAGDRDQRRIYMPHTGYTWSAIVAVVVHLAMTKAA